MSGDGEGARAQEEPVRIRAIPIIAELCCATGWEFEYVLGQPARRMFAVLEAIRDMRVAEKIDACDIQAIAIQNPAYARELKRAFLNSRPRPEARPVRPPNTIRVSPQQTHNALIDFFGGKAG